MADYRVPPQQASDLPANTFPRPALHRSHGHVQHVANPHGAGDDQQDVHWEGVPQPVRNVAVQGEMQYPHRIDTPNSNAAHYHPPPPPYPEQVPYVHMHRDVGVAEAVPAQAHHFAPDFPVADPPEVFPGVWPYPAPLANMPPANGGLRNLAGRYINNPDTQVNMLRIEPGRGGRFEVWIVLELADIF
ncbi:hypothetical protein BJY52DRAFT_642405 [Lactarius psammicola]|nr:hypothetical protein BJY52DRAFT_642405 [Lactarius psammicola]